MRIFPLELKTIFIRSTAVFSNGVGSVCLLGGIYYCPSWRGAMGIKWMEATGLLFNIPPCTERPPNDKELSGLKC